MYYKIQQTETKVHEWIVEGLDEEQALSSAETYLGVVAATTVSEPYSLGRCNVVDYWTQEWYRLYGHDHYLGSCIPLQEYIEYHRKQLEESDDNE